MSEINSAHAIRNIFSFLIVYALLSLSALAQPSSGALSEQQQRDWLRFWGEHQGHKLIMRFSAEYKPQTLAIVGVNVIPMEGPRILYRQTVIVENGKITRIGPDREIRPPKEANVITPVDHYLIPGLTEAHAHTISTQHQFLVYLTRGVTTLREMDGWPWMLEAKQMAANNELLIPNLYVSGHILSQKPFDFFMTKVGSPEQARRVVVEQAKAGFDFIKIHRSMPVPIFDALMKAAKNQGLPVVGHIPVEISLQHAIKAGMRSGEHFTGYIDDDTFEIIDQDYVSATTGAELWLTPTFTTYHDHLRGPEAWRLADAENSLRLVPQWLKRFWMRVAKSEMNALGRKLVTVYPKKREIFTNLRPVTDRFLAGTDTGTYSFMVPGYALQEEIRIFEELGLDPHDALKTATINAAAAMGQQAVFGSIEEGKRADFVVLTANPLESTGNLASIFGVALRGIWLSHEALSWIEDSLAEAFADDTDIPPPTQATLEVVVSEMEQLDADGFPYAAYTLDEIATFLRELGQPRYAERVEGLADQH